jgi:hypothetical protein
MDISQNDFKEAIELAELQKKIDNIDAEYMNLISDEIFQKQPFYMTVLLGYRIDTTPEELEEIMKIYFLIWEYFRLNKNVQTKKVTETNFETLQRKHLEMLQYAEGEPGQLEKMEVFSSDLQNLRSKALLTAVIFRYNNKPVLLKIDEVKRGIIFVGIKTFIKCFETI